MTIKNEIKEIGINARKASNLLSNITSEQKNLALKELGDNLKKYSNDLIKANKKDIINAKKMKISPSIFDRLSLDTDRILAMVESLDGIIALKDPINNIISEWERPNGLLIQKISVPLGVLGIIYESRPNVAVDASAICLKSGNAVILRGGSDSFYSSHRLKDIINLSFLNSGLPKNTVQMISSQDRSAVDAMIQLDNYIDLIIPRGGKGLIKKIKEKSSIPVIKHLDGICHIYVEKNADLKKAKNIIFNSKMRRPGICGAAETLLIDKDLLHNVNELLEPLIKANCEIRGDELIAKSNNKFKLANENDWGTEYLDKIISVKLVTNIEEAIEHINHYSSGHTESIITETKEIFKLFHKKIDSAIILQNASTQFADGGEFGFGGEIGISTDKLHVRGPVSAEHLTSFKYVIHGTGQVRS